MFDLSNNGLINGLTGLPACSRFVYPVYASPRFQQEIVDTLKKRRPRAVVYASNYWSFAIDDKTMHQRLPLVAEHLRAAYDDERCGAGYCLRYLKANP